jgi:membrane protease YdiL (CAAX protease family)
VLGSIFGVVFHATSSVVAGTILHAVMDWAERL